MNNGQIPLVKKLWGLVKNDSQASTCQPQLAQGTSCKTDLLCSLLDSKIFFFLNCYSNIIEEKKGPHRFPNKTPLLGVHWAADCPLQWFITLRSTFVQIITTLFSRLSWPAQQTFFSLQAKLGKHKRCARQKGVRLLCRQGFRVQLCILSLSKQETIIIIGIIFNWDISTTHPPLLSISLPPRPPPRHVTLHMISRTKMITCSQHTST